MTKVLATAGFKKRGGFGKKKKTLKRKNSKARKEAKAVFFFFFNSCLLVYAFVFLFFFLILCLMNNKRCGLDFYSVDRGVFVSSDARFKFEKEKKTGDLAQKKKNEANDRKQS